MKTFVSVLLVLGSMVGTAWAGAADIVMETVYGSIKVACTQDADADTGGANRLGPFTADKRYVVYCHDGAGAGVACECLQGGSSVSAASAVGILLNAKEKMIMRFQGSSLYLSCVPFVDNQMIDVCRLD